MKLKIGIHGESNSVYSIPCTHIMQTLLRKYAHKLKGLSKQCIEPLTCFQANYNSKTQQIENCLTMHEQMVHWLKLISMAM